MVYGSVCADEIVHGLAVPALDLEAFAGTKRVLLDLLQQPSTPHAPHLEPADLTDVIVIRLLLWEQKHGNLVFTLESMFVGLRALMCGRSDTHVKEKLNYSSVLKVSPEADFTKVRCLRSTAQLVYKRFTGGPNNVLSKCRSGSSP